MYSCQVFSFIQILKPLYFLFPPYPFHLILLDLIVLTNKVIRKARFLCCHKSTKDWTWSDRARRDRILWVFKVNRQGLIPGRGKHAHMHATYIIITQIALMQLKYLIASVIIISAPSARSRKTASWQMLELFSVRIYHQYVQ